MATYRTLIEALLKCSRADLAEKVGELLAQSKYEHIELWIQTCSHNSVLIITGDCRSLP